MASLYKYEQPALDFEKAHGLSGVAGRYIFDPSRTQQHLQQKIWSHDGDFQGLTDLEYSDIFHQLERLNPTEIGKIRFNRLSAHELNDVVNGIVSGFTPEDISFFIKRSHGGIPLKKFDRLPEGVARTDIETKIMQRLDPRYHIQWIASPTTLDNIWNQVKERPVTRPYDIAANMVKENAAALALTLGIATVGYFAWKEHKRQKQQKITANLPPL